jgi:MFS transporter, Spinster family, sphingosine-1-phosphate transporter
VSFFIQPDGPPEKCCYVRCSGTIRTIPPYAVTLAMRLSCGSHYKWIVVGLLWLVACLNYTDRMTIFSVFPLIKKEMGASDIALALLGSTFLWAYGACSPLGGYLGDRFSRKQVIIWSLLIFSLVTFATGLADSGRQLIALRVFLGVSEAIFLPAALAHVASFHSDSTRSLANAICLTGLTVGAGVGGFYGGYVGDHYSWRTGFFILGVVGLLVALILIAFLRDSAPSTEGPSVWRTEEVPPERLGRKILAILSTPTAACVVFLAFALSLTSWPTGSWVPTYLYERFGMSLTRSGLTMALFTYTPALVGSVLGGWWADRWARRDPRGRMSVQIVGLTFMAPTMLAMGFMPSGRALAGNLLAYSLARGLLEVNSMPIFSTVVARHRWSTTYGIYNLAGTLAGSLGVLFVGAMKASWGIGYSLSSMSVLLFMAIGVMGFALFRFLPRDMKKLLSDTSPTKTLPV